jgi:hypothetical protein
MADEAGRSWRNERRALRRKRSANLAEGPRTGRIVVKVSAAEKAAITAAAAAGGVTPARLLREAALADDEIAASSEDLRDLITELFQAQSALRAVSHNVNQMTRAANATGELAENTAHTLAATRRYATRIGDIVEVVAAVFRARGTP